MKWMNIFDWMKTHPGFKWGKVDSVRFIETDVWKCPDSECHFGPNYGKTCERCGRDKP